MTVVAARGLLHLLGVAKAFVWADVAPLEEPIGPAAGVLWLTAAVLTLVSARLIATGITSWWWAMALGAAVASQVAIATSWTDARAGTVANVLLVVVAAYGFVSLGPSSFAAQWRDQSRHALAQTDPAPGNLTEDDLTDLPAPLAAYVRRSGAVGLPRTTSFEATLHRDLDGRRVLVTGEGRWDAGAPEGSFAYIESHLDNIAYNVRVVDSARGRRARNALTPAL